MQDSTLPTILKKNKINYGIDLLTFTTDFTFESELGSTISEKQFNTEIAGYVSDRILLNRLILEPSFRLHYYASLQEMSPEPRLSAKFLITDWLRVKGAGGLYSQNLLSAQSDRDVVNLFYGFLSSPDQLPSQFRGAEVNSPLQKAEHLVGGVEIDFLQNFTINIESYLKNFSVLANINRNKIFENNNINSDKPEILRTNYIVERGEASGLDISSTYTKGKLYLYAAYSLMRVTRTDEFRSYFPHWDRRHSGNFIASYKVGKRNPVTASIRFNYGSGFPFTPTQGFYELQDFQDGIFTDYNTNNGKLGILYSGLNSSRLPDYHRLDASVDKVWNLNKAQELKITFSVINVYNRANIFYFNRVNYERVNQLPIMPSLAVKYSF